MTLSFLHPQAAWLLLLVPAFWWWARKRVGVTHRLLRCAIFMLLIAALAQPSLLHRAGGADQVVVLDQRASLSPAARAQAVNAARAMLGRRGARTTVIQLGGGPLDLKPARLVAVPEGEHAGSLSEALSTALDNLPMGSRGAVTVISDGLSRDRRWGGAIEALLRRGVVVNTVSLPPSRREAFIADVTAQVVRPGERIAVKVDLEGVGEGLSLAAYDGDGLAARSLDFSIDGARSVVLGVEAGRAGFQPLRIELQRGGRSLGSFDAIAAVRDPARLLYVDGRQAGGAQAIQRLLGPSTAVQAVRPEDLTGALRAGRYAGVLVDDVPAARLPANAQQALLNTLHEDGTGLFFSGGEAAFAAGGYFGAPLASALPVTIKQDQKTEDPSVALAVVIDTSGSMRGTPLELGKQVARLAVKKLTPADSVGVVEFYGGRQWVAPMQPARNIPDVERAISRVQAQGGSEHLFDALQEAYFGLKNTQARYKHILVVSDAGVEADRYAQLIRHMAQDQVTTSTVLVGGFAEGEPRMAQWARLGRGRFYIVRDEFSLVEINLKQPQEKPEPGYKRGSFAAASSPLEGGWWRGMDLGASPPLDGYAQAGERPQAETLLRTASGDPLLASWQYGAGRVTAMMTEPVGEGTRAWRGWNDYGAWLSRVVSRTIDQRPAFDVHVTRRMDRVTVAAQRLDGRSTGVPVIRLVGATTVAAQRVEEKAPGLFVAELPLAPATPAQVEVRDGDLLERAADPAFSDVAQDGRSPRAWALPLAQLARLTGGVHLTDPSRAGSALPAGRGGGDLVATDLWSWLCWLALAVYLAEIVYRRWPSRRPFA